VGSGRLSGVETQAQVKRTLSAPAALTYVRQQVGSGRFVHRTALADAVCATTLAFTMPAASASAVVA
jgi:hypothetical protein